jgi:hypothetical protein
MAEEFTRSPGPAGSTVSLVWGTGVWSYAKYFSVVPAIGRSPEILH